MSFAFFIYLVALLFSFFVIGAILGAVFAKAPQSLDQRPLARARRTIRALVFGWEFPPFNSGGLGVASLGLTRALAKHDVDVTFVLPKRFPLSVPYAKMITAEYEDAGAQVHYIDSPIVPYAVEGSYMLGPDGRPIYGSDLVSEVRRYAAAGARIAEREPHDIIYAHDWLSFGAGSAAKSTSHRPLMAHVHATEFDRTGNGGVNQVVYDIERAGMHTADRVIAVSHRTKDMVVARYGVSPDKMRVVWNGIDDDTAPRANPEVPARLSALKEAGYKIVLFAGRLTIQKGPDHFLRAAARVAKQEPDALFVIVGSGDMTNQLMRMAAGLGIGDRVLFAGFLRGHDLYEAYATADVFVMPSISEPFGIAPLEAMRAGTPIVISKQSGAAEAVPHAITVDFWDDHAMAARINELLASPQRRAAQVAQHAAVLEQLTWDHAGEKVRSVMDELVPALSA